MWNVSHLDAKVKPSKSNTEPTKKEAQDSRFNAVTMHLYYAMTACVNGNTVEVQTGPLDPQAADLKLEPHGKTKFGYHMLQAKKVAEEKADEVAEEESAGDEDEADGSVSTSSVLSCRCHCPIAPLLLLAL